MKIKLPDHIEHAPMLRQSTALLLCEPLANDSILNAVPKFEKNLKKIITFFRSHIRYFIIPKMLP